MKIYQVIEFKITELCVLNLLLIIGLRTWSICLPIASTVAGSFQITLYIPSQTRRIPYVFHCH